MKVAGYIRVSSVEQAVSGLSLPAQRELIESWCKEHNHELVGIYADEGVSASKELHKRKALLSMLEDVEKGKVELIVFKDITRWSRNSKQYWIVQDILDKCKVAWVSIQQPYLGTTDATTRFQTNIMLGMSQLEAEQTGERIRFVQDSQVRNGNYPFPNHCAAIGYKIDHTEHGTKLIVDNDNAEKVRDLFETFLTTANASKTARIMNDRYGWNIAPVNVVRTLKNRIYIGEFRGRTDFCEPIIPIDTFQSAQNMMKHRNVSYGKHTGEYVFSGLLRCAKCGCRMFGNYYEGKTPCIRYQCKTIGCGNLPRQDELENAVLNRIENMVSDYRMVVINDKPNRVNEYRSEQSKLRQRLSRLTDLYLDGDIDRQDYLKRKHETESRINDLEHLIQSESESVPPQLDMDWMEMYHSLTPAARNRFWKMCVESIYVNGNEPTEIRFLSLADDSTKVLADSFAKIKMEENIQ